jgi:APA family basic amino acid/polyamine antiporter
MKKQVGFFGLLALSVGFNIGGSLFGLTTVAAGLTGPGLPLALLVSVLPILLAVLPYAMMASAAPTTAGSYRYMQLLNPSLALVVILSGVTCAMIGGLPLMSQIFGLFFQAILPVDPLISSLTVLTIFYLVNVAGIRSAVWVQLVLVLFMISALVLYITQGATQFDLGRFAELFPQGIGGLLAAAGLLFTLLAGGLAMVDLGGEVVNARQTIPRVLLWGVLIVVAINLSILTVTAGAADTTALEGKTLVHVAANFMSATQLGYFIVAGALLACATSINTLFTLVSRWLVVLGSEGLLPRFLSRVDTERGSAFSSLTLAYVLAATALLTRSSLLFFGTLLNFPLLLGISLISLLVIMLPHRYPLFYERSAFHPPSLILWAVCGMVVVTNVLIFIFLASASHKATWIYAGMLLVTGLYAISRRKTLETLPRIAPAMKTEGGE